METVGAGALGPRLAGRLTAELILRSPQYMSCVKEYEIDLRGNKISMIENLGATENQFDSIDLSDNAIVSLEGFPKLPRLKTLLLNNNRIARIGPYLQEQIPNLESAVLTNNRLSKLTDVDNLASLSKLRYLSFLDNPITKQPFYRLYMIHKFPRLKALDFRKVKQKERDAAAAQFGAAAAAGPSEAADDAAGKLGTFEPDEEMAQAEEQLREQQQQDAEAVEAPGSESAGTGPTPEQITAIKAAIANAATLGEVQRLEDALRTGHLPSQVTVGGEEPAADANGSGAGDAAAAMEEG